MPVPVRGMMDGWLMPPSAGWGVDPKAGGTITALPRGRVLVGEVFSVQCVSMPLCLRWRKGSYGCGRVNYSPSTALLGKLKAGPRSNPPPGLHKLAVSSC